MKICKDVFKKYDIRGLYKEEITDELAFLIGKAFAKMAKTTVIVGYDSRTSSENLRDNLIKGLVESGINVIDIGLVTTPMLYYAREYLKEPFAIMITASHLSNKYNGFKLCDEDGNMFDNKINDLLNIILNNDFIDGLGSIKQFSITNDYSNMILEKIKLGPKKLKVVVDCGNGTTSTINPQIISDLGCDVIPLYCELNPLFPNHIPDPSISTNMLALSKKVLEENADLGIAFDSDGDRIGVVDENGKYIKSDILMIMIWKSIARICKNKIAAFDVTCSNSLKDYLTKLHLKPVFTKCGHSYMKNYLKLNDCDFAGESSGHFYFNDEFYGYDDALYAAGRILRILSYSDYSISKYFNDVPSYYSTDTKYIDFNKNNYDYIIEKIFNYAKSKGYECITIDGIRICFSHGFALVRKSNTTNSLCLRFEGDSLELLESYRLEIMKLINEEL